MSRRGMNTMSDLRDRIVAALQRVDEAHQTKPDPSYEELADAVIEELKRGNETAPPEC